MERFLSSNFVYVELNIILWEYHGGLLQSPQIGILNIDTNIISVKILLLLCGIIITMELLYYTTTILPLLLLLYYDIL